MSLIRKANKLFQNGEFATALDLYIEASNIYNHQNLDFNIKLCKKRVNENKQILKDVSEKSLQTNSFLNGYFDNVYVINLKHEVAVRLKISEHLTSRGISFEIFDATNGYAGEPLRKYTEYNSRQLGGLKRYPEYSQKERERGKPFIESAGAIGYIYTLLRVLKDSKEKGYKRFLVFEDDVLLSECFDSEFRRFIQNIDEDWKVLQLGASQYGWDSVETETASVQGSYFPRILDTCGSFAIAFDASIVSELIEAESAFEAPFDLFPMGEIYERYLGKCFVAYPNIAMPDVSDSSIRGGRCQYAHSKKMQWQLERFDYPLSKPSISIIITSKDNLKYYSNFSNTKNSPFNLRLFFNSSDGLRPLHNPELLDTNENKILPIKHLNFDLESDYLVTIDEREVLTEGDIVKFIEYKTSIRKENKTPLKELEASRRKIIADRVSVIIPTYKRPKHLRNALESVVNQDYHDIEIIVISDNGSKSEFSEETTHIVNSFKRKNSNFKIKLLEHNINRNGAAARNTGISNSTGEFICFLDDDDIYLQGRLSKSIEVLKTTNKTVGAVYCGFLGWNSPENDLNRYKTGDLTLEILLLDYKKHYIHTNTATYKREAVLKINGFDESYRRHQDLEFNLRFFEQYEINAVEECLARLNPEPSDVSNKAFNIVMVDLKLKFLTQFDYLIETFSLEDQRSIYFSHYNETLKYVTEKEKIIDVYNDKFRDYSAQMLIRLLS